MLDTLRNASKSWPAKLLIAVLVLSFAVWGVSGTLTGYGQNVVATVGDSEISVLEFDAAYRRELDALGRRIGRPLSTTEGAAFGVPGQVLGQLIAEAALNEVANRLNVGLSDAELVRLIQADPMFHGPGGRYDRNRLAQLLAANNISEDDYVEQRRRLAQRQQIAEALAGSLTAPAPYVEALYQHANQQRTVRFIELSPELVGDVGTPSEEVLTAYFEEKQADFRAPEYRKVNLLTLTPAAIAQPDAVSDEAARQAYDTSGDRFGEPERRRILQITFPNKEEAEAAAAELAAGKSFEDLLAERSLKIEDVDLGAKAKAELLDTAIAEAAYSLEEGAISGVVEGRFAPVILKVAEVTPAHTTPFEEVKAELKQEIATREAEAEVLDLHDEIEDARAGGATLQEVADRFNLTISSPAAFDSSGADAEGSKVDLPDARDLISEVFESDVGVENDPLQLGARGFVWFEVAEVTPERDRTLDEVRDRVVEQWQADQRKERLEQMASDANAQISSGKSIDEVAEALGVPVQTSDPIRRGAPTGALTPEAVQAAFSGPTGTVADVAGKDGRRLVLVVDSVSDAAFFAEAEDAVVLGGNLSELLQNSIIAQFVGEMEQQVGVDINQAAVARVIGFGES